ncbi:MAG: replication-associated recombination protein A, partial [Akkermansiaceae bacterium]|nr:replication-associated recombination protein A [Akkermansiaceae bacterium]
MSDLFSNPASDAEQQAPDEPLAARMRPANLAELAGQQHILAEGKLLRRAIESDRFTSLIFYGPP